MHTSQSTHCHALPPVRRTAKQAAAALLLLCSGSVAVAQTFPNLPISADQRGTAQRVAQAGVPLSELSPNAPERYTIQRGDTLWGISGLFLQRPWRWPELWGMNMEQIRNPHLIFPGQVLVLNRVGDRAFLTFAQGDLPTVRLSPRVRAESLADAAIPPIPLHVIEPFLTDAQVVDAAAHARAPRIVATQEGRTILSRGDRAYARGQYGSAADAQGVALSTDVGQPQEHRIYRNAVPLIDPTTREVLGYHAQFIGQTRLVRGETVRETPTTGGTLLQVQPATVDITMAREEVRVGDRLLPAPTIETPVYIPRAPTQAQSGQVIMADGQSQRFAGQNQVVILNRGAADGLQRGDILAILKDATVVTDSTDAARTSLHLPGERNGLMMVFRTFDRVSYALVLQVTDAVQTGDRFVNP